MPKIQPINNVDKIEKILNIERNVVERKVPWNNNIVRTTTFISKNVPFRIESELYNHSDPTKIIEKKITNNAKNMPKQITWLYNIPKIYISKIFDGLNWKLEKYKDNVNNITYYKNFNDNEFFNDPLLIFKGNKENINLPVKVKNDISDVLKDFLNIINL